MKPAKPRKKTGAVAKPASKPEYGAEIVAALSRQLEIEFGRGFGEKSMRHMIRFTEAFPDVKIVSSLLRQLSWTQIIGGGTT